MQRRTSYLYAPLSRHSARKMLSGLSALAFGSLWSLLAAQPPAGDPPPLPPSPAPEHSDEILFRVNQVTITRSRIELEFLAQVPVEKLVRDPLPPDERRKLLEETWHNAVQETVDAATLQAQSREEFDYLDFVAKLEPAALNEVVDQSLRDLELRYGGAELLQRQMERFHIDRQQLKQRMVMTIGISMFLRRKFSTLSRSTPDDQRAWYRDHQADYVQSSTVRLQRLAVEFTPGPGQTAAQIEAGIVQIAKGWESAAHPDDFAANLQKGSAFLPAWSVLAAAADGDWIEADRLPTALKTAGTAAVGAVLPPVTVAAFQAQEGFKTEGAAPLRPGPDAAHHGAAALLFRVADRKVTYKPYEEVVGLIRAQLDGDLFRQAKKDFLVEMRKKTLVTATTGMEPAISPWLLQVTFEAPPAKPDPRGVEPSTP